MDFKHILLILGTALLLTSCIKEDHFGESEYANIKEIAVSNQSGNAEIDRASAKVTVEIPGGVDLSAITVQTLELSSFASSNLAEGDVIDLNDEVLIRIISENGTERNWAINAFVASEAPQLDNNDLNKWYETATGYFEPGETANNTIWATGNRGTQLLNRLATIPKDLGNGNLAAQMETLDNGPLGTIFGAPISSGSLFTGIFNPDAIDPTNPAAATEFGTPFTGRPEKLKFKYSYIPGEINKDKQGNVLDYSDACDIYALLEVRLDGEVQRLATAWFRSDTSQPDLSTMEIEFTYGPLDASFPDYMKPENNLYVDAETAAYILPTHISFVSASSFDGDKFAGAIGSLLVVDDIEMVYE
ncbi:PCMD domain-containing protein [Aequorivita marina]|uniref:PCMD domain-containing protein n=1 Tax=Aequorivita marina TaxID=3073654 RepID=UPI002876E077|nr:PCMD domain-containing protein [Aequorivita sp. S2608]MDS1299149.1 PCMD domain-containing protein [Aequorivita sp. S2608]